MKHPHPDDVQKAREISLAADVEYEALRENVQTLAKLVVQLVETTEDLDGRVQSLAGRVGRLERRR